MTGLLLKYNKSHDDSLRILESKMKKEFQIIWGDLSSFGKKKDILSYGEIKRFIEMYGVVDFIIIGDVFWETGQNICKFGQERKIPIFFLQHGQWIYTKNKNKLNHYPYCTMLFGDDVTNMCHRWEYGKNSKCITVGSPRYDGCKKNTNGSYVYMSPPVIEESIHGIPNGFIRRHFLKSLEEIKGIDKEIQIVIHPHYRECRTDWLRNIFPKAQFADPKLHPFKLINGASKVIASRNSTVVLDAIAHGKMVVLTDLKLNDVCYFKRGYFKEFAVESEDAKDFFDNVLQSNKMINDINYQSRANRYIMLGNATSRIIDLIKKEMYNRL